MVKAKENLQLGNVVKSNQGGDKGKLYLVAEIVDASYIKVIDGVRHKLKNPKRKNVKHIDVIGEVVAPLPKIDPAVVTAIRRVIKIDGGLNV